MRVLRAWLAAAALPLLGGASCRFPDYVERSGTPELCDDGLPNGAETDTDCGGPDCNGCSQDRSCAEARDCASRRCVDQLCLAPSCTDGVQNGTETGRDCGANCTQQKCPAGEGCVGGTDCESQVCAQSKCQAPSCSDLTTNGGESDRDCGGGSADCPRCDDGSHCNVNTDCAGGLCDRNRCVPSHCTDDVQNEGETDVDCGDVCARCDAGQACKLRSDCDSDVCAAGLCAAPACDDGVKNGSETDLDCGGQACAACADGHECLAGPDCSSGVCQGGSCQAPSCSDAVKNGTEGDADCGGDCSQRCGDGRTCGSGPDCISMVCAQTCQPATCDDGARNQGEGDVDCGGPCDEHCRVGATCADGDDCISGGCKDGVCQATLIVFYKTDVSTSSQHIRPFVEIHNQGSISVPLAELEVRYFYTFEGPGTQVAECYFADPGCANVLLGFHELPAPASKADYYYSVGFKPEAGSVASGAGVSRIETAFHKEAFDVYDNASDYSYDPSKSQYTQHDRICLYRNGVLVWGVEP